MHPNTLLWIILIQAHAVFGSGRRVTLAQPVLVPTHLASGSRARVLENSQGSCTALRKPDSWQEMSNQYLKCRFWLSSAVM